eukprot:scaffold7659_cov140-Isochrysis_galbana.AAC.3
MVHKKEEAESGELIVSCKAHFLECEVFTPITNERVRLVQGSARHVHGSEVVGRLGAEAAYKAGNGGLAGGQPKGSQIGSQASLKRMARGFGSPCYGLDGGVGWRVT